MMKQIAVLFTAFVFFFTNPVFAGKENSPFVQPEKSYYLAWEKYQGDNVLGQCAEGYHFANVLEILDFSKLTYNTELGYTTTASGAMPPVYDG